MAIDDEDEPGEENPARVREHLANERTFLAWIRTGVAMMGFGFVVAELHFELAPRAPGGPIGTATLGTLFAVAGLVTVLLATWHYFAVKAMIDAGTYRPFGLHILLFALLTIIIGVAITLNLVGIIRLPG